MLQLCEFKNTVVIQRFKTTNKEHHPVANTVALYRNRNTVDDCEYNHEKVNVEYR